MARVAALGHAHPAPRTAGACDRLLQCRQALQVQERLAEAALPTLVGHGEFDVISAPADARRLGAGLRDAELHVLDGRGHVPIVTAPEAVARRIDNRYTRAFVAEA